MDKTIIRRIEKELGMIRFDHVSKLYGDKEALSDVNMTIANGEIFGLIGHNGAGKTTTISILTSIIEASYGEVYVDELPLSEHRDDIKKRIGYVPDSPDIFLNLTAIEYWHFLAKIYDVDDKLTDERIERLSHLFDIAENINDLIDSCDRIGILKDGKLIFIGTLDELKANHPDKDLETIYLELAGRKAQEEG